MQCEFLPGFTWAGLYRQTRLRTVGPWTGRRNFSRAYFKFYTLQVCSASFTWVYLGRPYRHKTTHSRTLDGAENFLLHTLFINSPKRVHFEFPWVFPGTASTGKLNSAQCYSPFRDLFGLGRFPWFADDMFTSSGVRVLFL